MAKTKTTGKKAVKATSKPKKQQVAIGFDEAMMKRKKALS